MYRKFIIVIELNGVIALLVCMDDKLTMHGPRWQSWWLLFTLKFTKKREKVPEFRSFVIRPLRYQIFHLDVYSWLAYDSRVGVSFLSPITGCEYIFNDANRTPVIYSKSYREKLPCLIFARPMCHHYCWYFIVATTPSRHYSTRWMWYTRYHVYVYLGGWYWFNENVHVDIVETIFNSILVCSLYCQQIKLYMLFCSVFS